ncbi:hypothetical protein Tco_0832395 [Tanacetum coccineum]
MQRGVYQSANTVLDEDSIRCNTNCNKGKSGLKQTGQTDPNKGRQRTNSSRQIEIDSSRHIRTEVHEEHIQADKGRKIQIEVDEEQI